MSACGLYAWCENDHSDPSIGPDWHEAALTFSAGDLEEEFQFELRNGVPKIYGMPDWNDIWIEPRESTNTFLDAASILQQASAAYERFVAELRAPDKAYYVTSKPLPKELHHIVKRAP